MAPLLFTEKNTSRMERWALAVGVNYYKDNQIEDLRYCAADAKALVDLFLSQRSYGFAEEHTRVLTSESQDKDRGTKLDILENLIELAQSSNEEDLLLFYFSGHGTLFDGRPYLVPSDARMGSLLPDTAIPLQRIKEVMQDTSRARFRVIILDACYMGVELRTKSPDEAQKIFMGSVKDIFAGAEGIAVLASSSHDEQSREDASKRHGAFTYYLLDALKNPLANENHDAYVTLTEVFHYVTQKVRQNYPQRPTLDFQGTGEIVLLPAPSEESGLYPLPDAFQRMLLEPVERTRDFCNRQSELDQIKDILSIRAIAVAIVGDRCTGKTSFLYRMKNLLGEDVWGGRRFACITLEPRSIRSVESLASELWDGLRKALQDAGLNPPAEMSDTLSFKTYADFAQRLEHLYTQFPDVTFVAFIDEFDKVFQDVEEVEYKRIIDLIHYIVEQTRLPVFFFMFLLRDLPELYGSSVASRRLRLKAFTRESVEKMVSDILANHAYPNKRTLSKLYEFGGGNPYFTKMLLEKLFVSGVREKSKWNLDRVFDDALLLAANSPEAHEVFGSIYSKYLNDDERYVVAWASSKADYVLSAQEISKKKAEIRTAISELRQRDYLIKLADGSYRLQIALMGEWFKGWSKSELELERLGVVSTAKSSAAAAESGITPEGICIDESTQQIYADGQRIMAEPTDLQYRGLVYFVQRVGQVISRDELVSHLHPDEAYLKSDQSLDTLIHRLRDLLGDRHKPYRFLETVHGRGFRMRNAVLVRTLSGE